MAARDNKKPEALVLVGMPGSGKSLWALNHPGKYDIASSDAFIKDYAKKEGRPYTEVFNQYQTVATKMMKEKVERLIAAGAPFIWDQTNLTKPERAGIYKLLHKTHRVIFVAFLVPLAVCRERNDARGRAEGQRISDGHMDFLAKSASFPDETEPHDRIVRIIHPAWTGPERHRLI